MRSTLASDRAAISAFVDRLRCLARYLAARDRRSGRALTDSDLCDLGQDVMTLLWMKRPTYAGAA